MKTKRIVVDNLKCGGCANMIKTTLQKIRGTAHVDVDVTNSAISIEHAELIDPKVYVMKLSRMGYPEQGTTNKLQTAKSYVSCAIGRVRQQ